MMYFFSSVAIYIELSDYLINKNPELWNWGKNHAFLGLKHYSSIP